MPSWNRFITLCKQTESSEQLGQLLHAFLTPEEREQIALRVELVKELLRQEKSQREIAKELKISIAKITRGSNMLKSLPNDTLEFLKAKLKT